MTAPQTADLTKVEASDRHLLLATYSGEKFTAPAGDTDPQPDHVLPLSLRRRVAEALGAGAGVVLAVPSVSEWERSAVAAARGEVLALAAANPFARGPTFNLTQQIELTRDNPTRAAELQRLAGL